MGADEALMLDKDGFVKTCNSTNFFIVRNGVVWAPTRKYQMQGITRAKTIELCRMHGIPIEECDFTLTEVYGADEVRSSLSVLLDARTNSTHPAGFRHRNVPFTTCRRLG